jgi:hypothetical protein
MRIPGFTAETTLNRARWSYRALTPTPAGLGPGALTLSTDNDAEVGGVDCNDLISNLFCKECGATGEGSITCCTKPPCFVIDRTPSAVIKPIRRYSR